MATVRLNLPIESGVAKRIKQYANSRKKSVSSIVENYFTVVTSLPKQNDVQNISPLVQSFSIENVNIPADFDYKEELANARNEKYL